MESKSDNNCINDYLFCWALLNCPFPATKLFDRWRNPEIIGVNIEGWLGSRSPRFWDWRVVGSPWNIIISYNVQIYEMTTKWWLISNICVKLNKNSADDALTPVLYVPPFVQLLGPTTPPVFKPDWRFCQRLLLRYDYETVMITIIDLITIFKNALQSTSTIIEVKFTTQLHVRLQFRT